VIFPNVITYLDQTFILKNNWVLGLAIELGIYRHFTVLAIELGIYRHFTVLAIELGIYRHFTVLAIELGIYRHFTVPARFPGPIYQV